MSHPHDGMTWIEAGRFLMGSNAHYAEEAPAHEVDVAGFWIDRDPVTNARFARFVEATGYVTLAERPADPAQYPGADPAMLLPASVVFIPTAGPVDLGNPYQWWHYVAGASWRHPRGPETGIEALADHPVVHVAFEDALAYAGWAGKSLPTEAEWEFAARGGLAGGEFAWGDEFTPGGRHLANTWQGEFPWQNLREDGHQWTSPVGAYPANGHGLHDMIGNVWEWTQDWYQLHASAAQGCCGPRGRRDGSAEDSVADGDPARIPRRVTKGGSHLCAPNYCRRYRPAARMAQPIDTSTSHLGFRCVSRAP